MKHNINYFLFFVLLSLGILTSCKKDAIVDNTHQVGISKVTYYASFNMTGDSYISVVEGQPFTDPGIAATQNGAPLPVTTSGTVNTAQVGIYVLNYSATNSDGFPASTSRTVAVLPSAETPGVDLSGTYFYLAAPATTSAVNKLAPGFYSTSNCWSASTTIPCLFICVDGTNITMPSQFTPFGTLFGTATLAPTGALTYSVSIPSQGLNNVARKWHLQ